MNANQTTTVFMLAGLERGAEEPPHIPVSFLTPTCEIQESCAGAGGTTMKHPGCLQDYLEHTVPAIRHAIGHLELMGSMNAASHQP